MRGEKPAFPVFGSPEYLVWKFNDISKATVSKRSKTAKEFIDLVKGLSTKKDNMRVCEVLFTEGIGCDGDVKGYVAQVSIGLNGCGRQADYCDAIKRLVNNKKMKVFVFDAWIDAIDDMIDVIVRIGD